MTGLLVFVGIALFVTGIATGLIIRIGREEAASTETPRVLRHLEALKRGRDQ